MVLNASQGMSFRVLAVAEVARWAGVKFSFQRCGTLGMPRWVRGAISSVHITKRYTENLRGSSGATNLRMASQV